MFACTVLLMCPVSYVSRGQLIIYIRMALVSHFPAALKIARPSLRAHMNADSQVDVPLNVPNLRHIPCNSYSYLTSLPLPLSTSSNHLQRRVMSQEMEEISLTTGDNLCCDPLL